MAINPFQGPINYSVDVQSPFEAALGGFKIGQQAGAEMQAQAQAREQKQQFQTGLSDFFKNPERTYEDLEKLLPFADKQQFEALTKVGEGMEKRKLDTAKLFSAQTLLALESNVPVAKTMLQERAEAETDPNQKRAFETILKVIDINPQKAAELIELSGAATFGKDWYQGITDARKERRAKEKQPFEVLKLSSEAIIKEQEAKFAPDKFLTDLNLTKEQINQAKAAAANSRAAAAKSGAEAKRAQAEADQILSGIIPAEKRPEMEAKFRKEYNDQTKPYQEVKSAYGRVLSSEDTAVGDLSLIFGYMKMLDPGSVVREGEFATAQNAAGVPERIMNIYNKVATGQRLSPSQRDSFKGQAKGLYSSALEGEKTVRTGLERISKGYGLNTNNIFYSATEQEPMDSRPAPSAEAGNTVKVAGQTYTRPANFTDAQWNAYKQSVGAK